MRLRYLFILLLIIVFYANERIVWSKDSSSICGNQVCENDEDETTCPDDCKIPQRCNDVYAYHENICIQQLGWERRVVKVAGINRILLWKAPSSGTWRHGSIIALHGGSGHASNFCSGLRIGKPMEAFSRMAIEEGFAVFSLDSTYARVTDNNGLAVGKRWDCMHQSRRANIDLAFIQKIITEFIPSLRPPGSHAGIFMTGISNGGFMTILAATKFSNELTAIAPVSAGDPFSTYFDMATHPFFERTCGPGVFRDSDTHQKINKRNACRNATSANTPDLERPGMNAEKSIPFKQFHHKGDAACDFSCMVKARSLLVARGFKDEGAYILKKGRRKIAQHFWQNDYNEPMIAFFKKYAVP